MTLKIVGHHIAGSHHVIRCQGGLLGTTPITVTVDGVQGSGHHAALAIRDLAEALRAAGWLPSDDLADARRALVDAGINAPTIAAGIRELTRRLESARDLIHKTNNRAQVLQFALDAAEEACADLADAAARQIANLRARWKR